MCGWGCMGGRSWFVQKLMLSRLVSTTSRQVRVQARAVHATSAAQCALPSNLKLADPAEFYDMKESPFTGELRRC